MKIDGVQDNARKKAFVINAGKETYNFPYAKLRLRPTAAEPVVDVFPDRELGNEAFTYRLDSGREDTVHLDAVLEVNQDPDYLQELLLHRLTVEALDGLEESGLGKRQLARQLGTSPSQLYRLLDPENSGKSVGQMLALLHLVDRQIDFMIYPRSASAPKSVGAFEVYRDKGGAFRFRLKDADGGVVLSSDSYQSRARCLRAIGKVRDCSVRDACYERTKTDAGKFLFRIRAADHHIIARSPWYHTASRRDAALATVRQKAADVDVKELGSQEV